MKNLFKVLLTTAFVLSLAACESDSEKRERVAFEREYAMEKLRSGQAAVEAEQSHERRLAYIQRPVAPGNYIDYRGNTSYGYWDGDDWEWNDPYSSYARESTSYLDYQIAIGAVTGAVLTRALWNQRNQGGWKSKKVIVNNYTTVNGGTMTKDKYEKRYKKLSKRVLTNKKVKGKEKPKAVLSKTTPTKAFKKNGSDRSKSTYTKGYYTKSTPTTKPKKKTVKQVKKVKKVKKASKPKPPRKSTKANNKRR